MKLEILKDDLTVCKISALSDFQMNTAFYFIARTDEELSLVCRTEDVPPNTIDRVDGWKAFRIQGPLDFSLVGVLSKITGLLAGKGISVFAVSTFNTDYILVQLGNFESAADILSAVGYDITG